MIRKGRTPARIIPRPIVQVFVRRHGVITGTKLKVIVTPEPEEAAKHNSRGIDYSLPVLP